MKRLLSTLLLLAALIAPSLVYGQTPTLVQSFVSAGNPVGIGDNNGNGYIFTLPNAVLAGDALVMSLSVPDGITVSSITDNEGNSWPLTESLSVGVRNGNSVLRIFVLPNANPGIETITIKLSGSTGGVFFRVEEWNNIATSSPVNGTSSNANVTPSSSSVSCGSFTPGSNPGGNLILAFVDLAGNGGGTPSTFAAGLGFTLHDADIAWTNGDGFPKASEYFVQTISAAINPSITINDDTSNTYNCGAIALKAAYAGGTPGSGIRIVKHLQFYNSLQSASTWVLQAPTLGNLRVFGSTYPSSNMAYTSVVDSESNTWSSYVPNEFAGQIFWSANARDNQNLTVTVNITGASGGTIDASIWDITGAATAQPGAQASADMSACNVTGVADQPDITPQASNSLVIAIAPDGIGPVTALTSPSGAISDMVQYTGKSDDSMFDSGDAWGHFYITSRATQNWTWTINQDPDGCLNASAVEFKAAQSAATNTHDFNGDGKSDIAWRDTSGNVAIWEMNGTTVLNPNTAGVGNVATTWSIVGTGDFNGDGNADILWRDTSGNVAIWEMNGTTVLNPNTVGVGNVPTTWSIVGTGDFNGDGKWDILWSDTSGNVAIWEMNGTTVLNPNTADVGNVPTTWTIVGTGDFNGDGNWDILWRDTSGNVAIWEMNGTTILNPNTAGVGNVPTTWSVVGTGDFNGDGNWDILWRDTSGNIAIWEMNGTTVLNPNAAGVGNVATSFKIVGSGDFNGDGKSDVLWRDTSGTVAIWFMNGTSVLNPNAAGVGNVPIIWTIQDALGG